jgi:metallophosphoesterase (TIGR00282 family)
MLKILFIGDVVGSGGRNFLLKQLPELKRKYEPTLIILNGENSANGKGITKKIAKEFYESGINVITLGNHAWDNREVFEFIDTERNMVRPANYPEGTPGQGVVFVKCNHKEVAIVNLQGRTYMASLNCPFKTMDELLPSIEKRTNLIFLDFHAEATSEKQALGWYLDGRISVMVGTHTHVQTADERILPKGTGYITDVGMVGALDSVLGIERESVIKRFITQLPVKFEVESEGRIKLNGVFTKLNLETGRCAHIERFEIVG